MKPRILLFVAALVMCSFLSNGLKAQVSVKDSLTLVALFHSTNGERWNRHTNWLTSNPVSTWYDVGVKNGKVVQLDLNFNHLTGKIPETIGDFDSIVDLQMNGNELTGSIPSSIGELKTLQDIYLADNMLSGEIPSSMGNMTSLQTISMGDNQFSGELPPSLANCPKLSGILLYNNKLTGNIPSSFKNLVFLSTLELDQNFLSGELQDVFADHCPLQLLSLSFNNFSGSISAFLGRFGMLYELYMENNHFTGPIPAEMASLHNLGYLDLSYNELTGDIPDNFFQLFNIYSMQLNNNHLTYHNNLHFSGHNKFSYADYFLENNDLTFDGLEFLVQRFKFVSYNPQARLTIHNYHNKLAVSAGGTLSNNTYQWFRTGQTEPVTLTGDSTFQPMVSGIYYAKITNSIVKNLILKTDTFHYALPTSKTDLKPSIAPNPARGIVWVRGLDAKKELKITIADISGYVWMTANSRRQTAISLDASRLNPGNYLVTVSDGKDAKTVEIVKE